MIEYFLNDIGIIFHTHRVAYPNVLSAQVLPPPLKELAIQKLVAAMHNIQEYKLVKQHPELLQYTIGQIQDNINYLLAKDQSDKWTDCVEFNRRLDATRNQSFLDVTPEFKDYV